MWRWAAYVLFLALGAAMTLASVYVVLELTQRIPDSAGAFARSLAVAGALLVSVLALLAAIYFAVRLAVLLLDKQEARK